MRDRGERKRRGLLGMKIIVLDAMLNNRCWMPNASD